MLKNKIKLGLGFLAVLVLLFSAAALGQTPTGDTAAGDAAAGDTVAGDTTSGDTAAGDSVTGDGPIGDILAGDSSGHTVAKEATWQRFVCPAGKFALDLPPGWRQLDQVPDVMFAAAGVQEGPKDPFIENLTVSTAPNSPPRMLEDFVELYLRQLPSSVEGYQFVEQTERQVDGRVARRLVFFMDLEGERVEVVQTIFIKGDKVYFVTFTDSPDTFGWRQADFDRAVASLKFD